MTILRITLLAYSLWAAFPSQNPVNKQAVPDIAKDGGPRIVLCDNSALSQFKVPQSDIDALQSKFTKDNHVDVFLDLAELVRGGLVLWWNPEVDVTKRFVEACSEYQKTGALLLETTTIPKASIAILSTDAMFDDKTGIKQIAKRFKEAIQKFPNARKSASEREAFDKYLKEANGPIFEALDAFAKERGFNLIFNSTAQQNLSVYSLPSTDISRVFIDKYNKLHP